MRYLLSMLLLTSLCSADPAERFLEAAEEGDLSTMQRLHVRVNVRDDEGETALMEASEEGRLEVVRWLLERGANPNLCDREGETALMEAAEAGQTAVAALLLDRGARLNETDRHGRTALMRAAGENHPETVALLLQRGAAVGLLDDQGRSALSYAESPEIRALLLRRAGLPPTP